MVVAGCAGVLALLLLPKRELPIPVAGFDPFPNMLVFPWAGGGLLLAVVAGVVLEKRLPVGALVVG